MAAAGLLAVIDDIATILDDVALLSKVAAKKTAGVLGDDLALNAQQVTGVQADRELSVVWAVFLGSAKNKLILVPVALLLSAFLPWTITPLLMLGGAFLCFEGTEKIAHALFHRDEVAAEKQAHRETIQNEQSDLRVLEKGKIKGAIRTDFILSAEIVVIALGTVQTKPFLTQVLVLSFIAVCMTVGVYGLVAAIVKLDDAGLHLLKNQTSSVLNVVKRGLGLGILWFCPYLMKMLSLVGTAAMFLVGGGIILHGLPFAHTLLHTLQSISVLSVLPEWLLSTLVNGLFGLVVGVLLVMVFESGKRFVNRKV